MSDRTVRTAAWSILSVCAVLWLGLSTCYLLAGGGSAGADPIFTATLLLFPAFGALIAQRRPENHYGFVFSGVGLVWMLGNFADAYASYAISQGGIDALPATTAALWVVEWAWFPEIALLITFPLLLFPDGRAPGPRWRFLPWLAALIIAAGTLANATTPGVLDEYDSTLGVQNPVGLGLLGELPGIIIWVCMPVLIFCALASAASLITRFRRAKGIERLQLKWFMYAGALVAGAVTLNVLAYAYSSEVGEKSSFLYASLLALPLAAGIAVLRYRLYDIDRIINRTLVYGLLTALLAALYIGLVVGLQEASQPLSGSSDLAIALTTLIVAALFLPARRRVQHVVDRRFNRRAYDAARTIEVFGARLRQNIDLDTLRYELLAVVDETMEPSRVSLWLRPREAGR